MRSIVSGRRRVTTNGVSARQVARSVAIAPAVELALLCALLVIAHSVRVVGLASQSLWYDEGTSLALAPRSLTQILDGAAADIHPPFYYLSLHFWLRLVGNGEFAARYLSVIPGVLTVAAASQVARLLYGRLAGIVTGILVATSPLLVYYSQEARMYALTAAGATLGLSILVRLLRRSERGEAAGPLSAWPHWLGLAATSGILLYTHYFAFAALSAQMLIVGGWIFAGGRHSWRTRIDVGAGWIVSQLIATVVFLPWLIRAVGQVLGWPSVSDAFTLAQLLRRVVSVFSFGLAGAESMPPEIVTMFVCAAIAGVIGLPLATGPRQRSRPVTGDALSNAGGLASTPSSSASPWLRWAVPALGAGVPVVIMYLLSLQRPLYNPKFLLVAAPAYDLLLVGAVLGAAIVVRRATQWLFARQLVATGVGSLVGALLVFVLIAGHVQALRTQITDPRLGRDDYRGLTALISRDARPDDAIVLNAPGQQEIFDYYFRTELNPRYPLPKTRPMDENATTAELRDIVDRHGRVWLVLWGVPESDPSGLIERWLDDHLFKTSNRWFGGVRLALYVNPDSSSLARQFDARASFADQIDLVGAEALAVEAQAGDVVPITLSWQARTPVSERLTVFVHLLDQDEYLWGQRDSEPAGGARPTTSWQVGDVVSDRHGVPVLPGTPPGTYQIEIGLYDARTGARLPVTGSPGQTHGDRLVLGSLEVTR
ncbi:MAG TPA: glycosyltransferase family 39 protein, partial [Chloroflexota bacterium]|nr:glycosyltransferase family 39 protein [Chloroflexota bacterium]